MSRPLREGPIAVVLEILAVLAASVGLCVYITWPLFKELGDHIYGLGGDSTGGMAILRLWADQLGYSLTGFSHVTAFGAPFGFDQGNGVNAQSAFAFFPAYVIAEISNEVLAYNFVVLSGLVLSGAAMYWLVRWLGCARLVAAWAGLVFIIFPWHLEKAQGHASLTHLEGLPLLLLALLAWYAQPTFLRVLFVAGALGVLWTTSGYFGLMAMVLLPIPALAAVILHRREGRGGTVLGRVVLPAALWLAVPAVVYGIASTGSGAGGIVAPRAAEELRIYGARPWEFVLPSYRNPQFGDDVGNWLFGHLHGSNFSETSLYVGWLTILLAAAWLGWVLVNRTRLRRELGFATLTLVAAVAVGLVFSLPSPLPRTGIPAPSRLIWEVSPQFRVSSRFVALVMAGLVPLAALGLGRICIFVSQRVGRRLVASAAAAAVCVAAGVLSFVELSISPPATLTDLSTAPAEYAAVRTAPPGLLAEYPLASAEQAITSDYLFWRKAHGRRIVNGSPPGTFADSVRETLVNPATRGTAEALATLGVSAIVVRPNAYAFTGGPPVAPERLGKGYRLLTTTPAEARVWQVVARPAPAVAGFVSDFYGPETPTPKSTMRWMLSTGEVELYTRRPGVYRATFSVNSYGRPRRLRIQGENASRTVEAPLATKVVSFRVSLPRGRSTLTLRTNPGAELLPDGRSASVYMSNWQITAGSARGEGSPPLRARPSS